MYVYPTTGKVVVNLGDYFRDYDDKTRGAVYNTPTLNRRGKVVAGGWTRPSATWVQITHEQNRAIMDAAEETVQALESVPDLKEYAMVEVNKSDGVRLLAQSTVKPSGTHTLDLDRIEAIGRALGWKVAVDPEKWYNNKGHTNISIRFTRPLKDFCERRES